MPSNIYRYEVTKESGEAFEFETADGVFVPTHTSQLLIQAARERIRAPGKLLDLGCGIGILGLTLARLGFCRPPVFFSDLSDQALATARRNAQRMEVAAEFRQGPLFEPWTGERFDCVIADVPGISEEIARLSPWFPEGIECRTGRDGTTLVVQALEQAPSHLNEGGTLLFPILSLSRESRILEAARAHFPEVDLVCQQTWLLPEQLKNHMEKLQLLREEGAIQILQKVGMWLWTVKVYQASGSKG